MAGFNKFQSFIGQIGLKQHDLNADPLFVFLTNEQPLVGDDTRADIADLSTSGGYTAGGEDTQNTYSEAAGVGSCVGTDITWTATTGFGPFQFAVLYNQVGGLAGTNKLVGWWDYGSAVTLGAGETFKTDFGATMFTLA